MMIVCGEDGDCWESVLSLADWGGGGGGARSLGGEGDDLYLIDDFVVCWGREGGLKDGGGLKPTKFPLFFVGRFEPGES